MSDETEETIEIAAEAKAENETSQLPKNTKWKIAKIGTTEHTVEFAISDADLRTQLLAAGYADVGAATIKKSERDIAGERYEVIEFIKKTGTKGSDINQRIVAAILAAPRAELPARYLHRLNAATIEDLLHELRAGTITADLNKERTCQHVVNASGPAAVAARPRHGW